MYLFHTELVASLHRDKSRWVHLGLNPGTHKVHYQMVPLGEMYQRVEKQQSHLATPMYYPVRPGKRLSSMEDRNLGIKIWSSEKQRCSQNNIT